MMNTLRLLTNIMPMPPTDTKANASLFCQIYFAFTSSQRQVEGHQPNEPLVVFESSSTAKDNLWRPQRQRQTRPRRHRPPVSRITSDGQLTAGTVPPQRPPRPHSAARSRKWDYKRVTWQAELASPFFCSKVYPGPASAAGRLSDGWQQRSDGFGLRRVFACLSAVAAPRRTEMKLKCGTVATMDTI